MYCMWYSRILVEETFLVVSTTLFCAHENNNVNRIESNRIESFQNQKGRGNLFSVNMLSSSMEYGYIATYLQLTAKFNYSIVIARYNCSYIQHTYSTV
jgi:hypothetical protein